MEFQVDLGHVISIAALFVTLLVGTFWRIWAMIEKGKKEALAEANAAKLVAVTAQSQFSDYRTHVAETYATKVGLTESLTMIHDALDRLTQRIDAALFRPPGQVDSGKS